MHNVLYVLIVLIFLVLAIRYKLYILLYIPRNPFSPALETDMMLMMRLPKWGKQLYLHNLTWRRQKSLNRDLISRGQPPIKSGALEENEVLTLEGVLGREIDPLIRDRLTDKRF